MIISVLRQIESLFCLSALYVTANASKLVSSHGTSIGHDIKINLIVFLALVYLKATFRQVFRKSSQERKYQF